MTLADDHWISTAPGTPTRWELTHHILTVAYLGRGEEGDLRQRARTVLEQLRDDSGESALLIVPDVRNFIVVDSADSRQMLRISVNIGMVVPANSSATGRCLLAYFDPERQGQLLGSRADEAMLEHFRVARQRGWSASNEVVVEGVSYDGATTIAAPIFDAGGRPTGTLAITGPTGRLTPERQAELGPQVAAAANALSRGTPRGGFGD